MDIAPTKNDQSMSLLKGLMKQQDIQGQINKIILGELDKRIAEAKKEIQEYTDHAIEEIKKYIPLSDGEATQLKSAVASRARITTQVWLKHKFNDPNYGGQGLFSKKYGHIIRSFYSLLKKHFDAIKYTAILHDDFEDAIKFANQLNYYSLPSQTLRITESQLRTLNEWEKRQGLPLTEGER